MTKTHMLPKNKNTDATDQKKSEVSDYETKSELQRNKGLFKVSQGIKSESNSMIVQWELEE